MARDLEERRELLKQRQAALQQKAAKLAKEERAWHDRRKIIVGATVLNAMATDPELAARVIAAVKTAVTRDSDKKHVEDLLGVTVAPAEKKAPAAV